MKQALTAFTFWHCFFVETTVPILCNTVCIPTVIRFQVSNAFISAVKTNITLKGRTSIHDTVIDKTEGERKI